MSVFPVDAWQRFEAGKYSLQDMQALLNHFHAIQDHTRYRQVRIAAKRLQLRDRIQQNEPLRIQVVATSDDEKDEYRKLAWGDYWLQYELIKSLGEAGFIVTREKPHVTWHLFGFPRKIPPSTYNIVWCTSHPELLLPQYAFHYDAIFTLSQDHADILSRAGLHAETLHAASAKTPYPVRVRRNPAIFIGNAKPDQPLRPSVRMLRESGYPYLVWGWGWEGVLPQENIAGRYFDYNQLSELYASSAYVVNDHHEKMVGMGMVSPKNFDICSSGGFLVCERNKGIDRIFGDSVPQFSTTEELKAILFGLDNQPEKREAMRTKAIEISLRYSFDRLIECIKRRLYDDCSFS